MKRLLLLAVVVVSLTSCNKSYKNDYNALLFQVVNEYSELLQTQQQLKSYQITDSLTNTHATNLYKQLHAFKNDNWIKNACFGKCSTVARREAIRAFNPDINY